MKVYQINTVCGYGSTGRIASELGYFIIKEGHDSRIAYGRKSGRCSYNNSYYIGSKMDHLIHGLLARITDKQGLYSSIATKDLIYDILDYNPNIIHLHNIHGYYLNYKILFDFLKEYNKPVVWTFHDCWPFTGHCSYFDIISCVKWKNQCKDCPLIKEYPTSYIFDNSSNNYILKRILFNSIKNLTIVSPSMWLDNLVGESFLQKNNHIVINNGIDLNTFKPKNSDFREIHGINDKIMLLGVASIWGKRKGYGDFLKLSKIIDKNTVIVMVGLKNKELKNLPSNIIGIKRTNCLDDLIKIYSAADFYLNLTYQDNFPTTNIEALACGTPVLTYNTGGSVECITEKTGQIIECGNYKEITDIINTRVFSSDDCLKKSKDFCLEVN